MRFLSRVCDGEREVSNLIDKPIKFTYYAITRSQKPNRLQPFNRHYFVGQHWLCVRVCGAVDSARNCDGSSEPAPHWHKRRCAATDGHAGRIAHAVCAAPTHCDTASRCHKTGHANIGCVTHKNSRNANCNTLTHAATLANTNSHSHSNRHAGADPSPIAHRHSYCTHADGYCNTRPECNADTHSIEPPKNPRPLKEGAPSFSISSSIRYKR